jgi:hypothetical protein
MREEKGSENGVNRNVDGTTAIRDLTWFTARERRSESDGAN